MRRRYFEVLVLLCLVALFQSLAWERTRPLKVESTQEIEYEEFDLNIHGVRLGMTVEQLRGLHGEPTELTDCRFEYGSGSEPYLEVTFGPDGTVDGVGGNTLSNSNQQVLGTWSKERGWTRMFGSVVPAKSYEPPLPCEWFQPEVAHYNYHYPELDLYIEATETEGLLSPPLRATRFFLSEKRLQLLIGLHLPVTLSEH